MRDFDITELPFVHRPSGRILEDSMIYVPALLFRGHVQKVWEISFKAKGSHDGTYSNALEFRSSVRS